MCVESVHYQIIINALDFRSWKQNNIAPRERRNARLFYWKCIKIVKKKMERYEKKTSQKKRIFKHPRNALHLSLNLITLNLHAQGAAKKKKRKSKMKKMARFDIRHSASFKWSNGFGLHFLLLKLFKSSYRLVNVSATKPTEYKNDTIKKSWLCVWGPNNQNTAQHTESKKKTQT